jgi:Delta7-sterol 5-desaturase
MSAYKSFRISKTPLWIVIGAAIIGAFAAFLHPATPASSAGQSVITEFAAGFAEYLYYSAGFFALFWIILHRFLPNRQIARRRWPKLSQISRELLFSVCSQFVMLGVGAWIAFGETAIVANMYSDIGQYGWAYFAFITFMLFAVDDTVFYWAHRWMHHPRLFKAFHRVHHESTDPTPFTSFSFHPLEAVILALEGTALILMLMVLPWHPVALAIYGLGSLLFNIIGHLGYEIYPASWNRIPILRWKTTAMHHYLHHQMVGGNFGLYFRWWDKMCGTEFADYEARYDRFFAAASRKSSPRLETISTHLPDASQA